MIETDVSWWERFNAQCRFLNEDFSARCDLAALTPVCTTCLSALSPQKELDGVPTCFSAILKYIWTSKNKVNMAQNCFAATFTYVYNPIKIMSTELFNMFYKSNMIPLFITPYVTWDTCFMTHRTCWPLKPCVSHKHKCNAAREYGFLPT